MSIKNVYNSSLKLVLGFLLILIILLNFSIKTYAWYYDKDDERNAKEGDYPTLIIDKEYRATLGTYRHSHGPSDGQIKDSIKFIKYLYKIVNEREMPDTFTLKSEKVWVKISGNQAVFIPKKDITKNGKYPLVYAFEADRRIRDSYNESYEEIIRTIENTSQYSTRWYNVGMGFGKTIYFEDGSSFTHDILERFEFNILFDEAKRVSNGSKGRDFEQRNPKVVIFTNETNTLFLKGDIVTNDSIDYRTMSLGLFLFDDYWMSNDVRFSSDTSKPTLRGWLHGSISGGIGTRPNLFLLVPKEYEYSRDHEYRGNVIKVNGSLEGGGELYHLSRYKDTYINPNTASNSFPNHVFKTKLEYMSIQGHTHHQTYDFTENVAVGVATIIALDLSKTDLREIAKIPELRNQIISLTNSISQLRSSTNRTISQLRTDIANKTRDLNDIQSKLNSLINSFNQNLPNGLSQVTQDNFEERLNDALRNLNSLQADWESIKEKYKELGYGDLNNVQELLDSMTNQKQALDTLQNKINEILTNLSNLTGEQIDLNNLEEKFTEIFNTLNEKQTELDLIKEEFKKLNLEETGDLNKILEKINELKQKEDTLTFILEKLKSFGFDENSDLNEILDYLNNQSNRLKEIEKLLKGGDWEGNTAEEMIEDILKKYNQILEKMEVKNHEELLKRLEKLLEIEKKYSHLEKILKGDPVDKVDNLLKDKADLLENKTNLEKDKANLESQNQKLTESNFSYEKTLKLLGEKIQEFKTLIENLYKQIEEYKNKIIELENKLKEKEKLEIYKIIINSLGDNLDELVTRDELGKLLVDISKNANLKKVKKYDSNFIDTTSNTTENLYEFGITTGTTLNTFAPNEFVTRKMLGAFLLRFKGIRDFNYEDSVNMAIQEGIFKEVERDLPVDKKELLESLVRILE